MEIIEGRIKDLMEEIKKKSLIKLTHYNFNFDTFKKNYQLLKGLCPDHPVLQEAEEFVREQFKISPQILDL